MEKKSRWLPRGEFAPMSEISPEGGMRPLIGDPIPSLPDPGLPSIPKERAENARVYSRGAVRATRKHHQRERE